MYYKIIFKEIVEYHYQVLWHLWLWSLKLALTEWKMYSIKNVAQFTFCHFQKLVLVNILSAYETVIYNFREHIFVTVSYRFIPNLEAIKGKDRRSWNLRRFYKVPALRPNFQAQFYAFRIYSITGCVLVLLFFLTSQWVYGACDFELWN